MEYTFERPGLQNNKNTCSVPKEGRNEMRLNLLKAIALIGVGAMTFATPSFAATEVQMSELISSMTGLSDNFRESFQNRYSYTITIGRISSLYDEEATTPRSDGDPELVAFQSERQRDRLRIDRLRAVVTLKGGCVVVLSDDHADGTVNVGFGWGDCNSETVRSRYLKPGEFQRLYDRVISATLSESN